MFRFDRLAIIFSLLAVAGSLWISDRVFENLPHIEDEFAYVWQAETFAEAGALKLSSPPCPTCFLVPFVIDYHGERFGKYPLAWPVVLSFGIRFGARNLVNPFLAGLGVWLTYRLGKKILGGWVGIIAAFLTLTSPFFLMNSSSLLSHPLSLDLSLVLAISWMDTFYPTKKIQDTAQTTKHWNQTKAPSWLTALLSALALGTLVLTRPLTAVAVGLPFAVHGIYLLWKGSPQTRRLLILVGLVTLLESSLYFLWQYSLTGNALMNPYTLWWPNDKIGFGKGIGDSPEGNYLPQILTNIYTSLRSGASDLFGWGMFSWIFIPFGIWAIRRKRRAWLVGSVFFSLVLVYTLYWIGSWLFGPRYYYEGIYSLTILSAAGIAWLAGIPIKIEEGSNTIQQPWIRIPQLHPPDFAWIRKHYRPILIFGLMVFLTFVSIFYYDPARIGGLEGLYGVSREHILPFLTPQARTNTPALVIVHTQSSWIEYGTLLDLENPLLTSPFIFMIDKGPELNQIAINAFPGRKVIDYYTNEPNIFYFPKVTPLQP